jgi:hypothetical protein
MQNFIVTLVLAALPLVNCLADAAQFLVVNGKNGTKTTFALADNPKLSCKGGELTVVAGSRTFTLSLNEILNYQFTAEPTGIKEIVKDGSVKLENSSVVFSGLNALSIVSVYQQDGRLIKDYKTDADGNAVVDLSDFPKGILIIHSNKTDLKIINR